MGAGMAISSGESWPTGRFLQLRQRRNQQHRQWYCSSLVIHAEIEIACRIGFGRFDQGHVGMERQFQEVFFPVDDQLLFPFFDTRPDAVGVRTPPNPAPPQRTRSAQVPWGTNSTASSPASICFSASGLRPIWVVMMDDTRWATMSLPTPGRDSPPIRR